MDTNFKMVRELNKVFEPKRRGVLDGHEVNLIRKTLHLEEMNELQLRNLRDFVVMYFSLQTARDSEKEFDTMDKVSGITGVIDWHIFDIGGEV